MKQQLLELVKQFIGPVEHPPGDTPIPRVETGGECHAGIIVNTDGARQGPKSRRLRVVAPWR